MRRLLIGACAVLMLAAAADAAIQGYPDTATITGFVGVSNTVGGSGGGGADPDANPAIAMAVNHVLLSATQPGTANRITLGSFLAQVQIDFTWTSSSNSGFWKTNSPNLVIYYGVTGASARQAVEANGILRLLTVDYDTGSGFGSNINPVFKTYSGGAGGLPAFVAYHTIGNAPGSPAQIVGVRLTLESLRLVGSTTFWIGAIQSPEPGTFALFGLGLAGAGFFAMRRRRNHKKV